MKPEKLLLLPPGKDRVEAVLNNEMAQIWSHLITLSDTHGFPRQLIGVVSSSPREGTTTTTVALARFLVYNIHKKVCIVETNLRNPTLGRLLPRLEKEPGFHEVLKGKLELAQAIRVVDNQGLHLVTAGETSQDVTVPREETLRQVTSALRKDFDSILFDCPPLGLAAEANYFLKECDTALYVARASKTRLEHVAQGVKTLRTLGTPLAGVVMNNVIYGLPGPLQSLF